MNVQISIGIGLSHLGFLDLKQCWLLLLGVTYGSDHLV